MNSYRVTCRTIEEFTVEAQHYVDVVGNFIEFQTDSGVGRPKQIKRVRSDEVLTIELVAPAVADAGREEPRG